MQLLLTMSACRIWLKRSKMEQGGSRPSNRILKRPSGQLHDNLLTRHLTVLRVGRDEIDNLVVLYRQRASDRARFLPRENIVQTNEF